VSRCRNMRGGRGHESSDRGPSALRSRFFFSAAVVRGSIHTIGVPPRRSCEEGRVESEEERRFLASGGLGSCLRRLRLNENYLCVLFLILPSVATHTKA
jgi:hypothetical protein